MIQAQVAKRHKRLIIESVETGQVLYCPPDFIKARLHSRDKMIELAEKITRDPYLLFDHIYQFESQF